MKATILGPHPGNSLSILYYFTFYCSQLPGALPDWDVVGECPGGISAPGNEFQQRNLTETWWDNFVRWPAELTRIRADVLHIVDQGLAWYGQFLNGGRRLVTVHDLIAYMTWKGALNLGFTPSRRKFLLRQCVGQIQRADHIVSVSNCTAGHLISFLGIPASRITVVPDFVKKSFSPLSAEERVLARKRWFGDTEYVVIHVGTAISYKNRIGALRAFDRLYDQLSGAKMFLVHGTPSREELGFLKQCACQGAIRFLPPITLLDLREFYGSADVLIFPSLYEGFGIPPLEAMACGCPVVCTNRGALGEVVGEAAIKVDDPYDYDALAGGLLTVLQDRGAADELRRRGLEQVKNFAEENILGQMAEVYRLLGEG
jgi:glycosyltransferase involved in cell wall biosynthesis